MNKKLIYVAGALLATLGLSSGCDKPFVCMYACPQPEFVEEAQDSGQQPADLIVPAEDIPAK